jgi:histidinol-phosphatase (PHP family)
MTMPFSHHSHSGQFCKHGSGSLEDVVREAIRQGFEVYGLTEHVPRYRSEDLYPEEVRNAAIRIHSCLKLQSRKL